MPFLRIYEGGVLREQHKLTADRTRIGRANSNHIVLDHPSVSAHHVLIARVENSFVLVDTDSANGVFVNGVRVRRHLLEYWEEIQIPNFVLKFMPHAKLPGDQQGRLRRPSRRRAKAATMAVDVSGIADLVAQRRRVQGATLEPLAGSAAPASQPLCKGCVTIGRGTDCDVVLQGWLAPRLAARIQRRTDGHFVIPARRGRVRINDKVISQEARLQDGDRLEVRGLAWVFSQQAS